jgi:hypothetical protein
MMATWLHGVTYMPFRIFYRYQFLLPSQCLMMKPSFGGLDMCLIIATVGELGGTPVSLLCGLADMLVSAAWSASR